MSFLTHQYDYICLVWNNNRVHGAKAQENVKACDEGKFANIPRMFEATLYVGSKINSVYSFLYSGHGELQ